MKNISLCIAAYLISLNAIAQIINIPDANFKARLLLANTSSEIAYDNNGNYMVIDTNGNNEIEVSEAQAVYGLNVLGAGISSLTGIEGFTNLITLGCYNNNLTSLPISNLTNLTYLSCFGNMLASLPEIENLTNLVDLGIGGNPLTSINLQNLHQLQRVDANATSLTEINLCGTVVHWLWATDNPNLQALYLKNNIISSDEARMMPTVPPPLHNFEFYNSPLLTYICYDEGEYPAVFHGIGENTTGKSLTTSCNANCASLPVENPMVDAVSIYPNPTSGIINIIVANNQLITKTTICNLLGQMVLTFENATSLDISSLNKGTYFITTETVLGKQTQKIIKI